MICVCIQAKYRNKGKVWILFTYPWMLDVTQNKISLICIQAAQAHVGAAACLNLSTLTTPSHTLYHSSHSTPHLLSEPAAFINDTITFMAQRLRVRLT